MLYPDSEDKGPVLGVRRKKNNNSKVSRELTVNLKVSSVVLCHIRSEVQAVYKATVLSIGNNTENVLTLFAFASLTSGWVAVLA